jgi:N-acyl-D-aspartate/D-glutamate deacylase
MLDLVVRGGQLVDGTGATRRRGDVGVRDGRIVALGEVDEPAAETIDADGALVAPGFVDVHTHYDAQVIWDPALTPSSLHGVTTVIGGNCGFSVAPLNKQSAEYLMSMLARVEGMPLASLEKTLPWDWESTADYLERLSGNVALNVGFMVGHSALRRVVMGEAGKEREATGDELDAMKRLLRRGLAEGGLGFSSSLAQSHTDASGDPVPSRHASSDELLELAAVCGEFGGTSLELVPQAGGDRFGERVKNVMVGMSVRAGRALNWNILHARASNRDEVDAKLAVADEARAAGGKVVGLLMPMPVKLRLNFMSGFVLDMLPGWDKLMALASKEKLELLSSPGGRARLRGPAEEADPRSHFADWGSYQLFECFTPATQQYEGRLVADIAREERKHPFDALADVVVADRLRTTFGFPAIGDERADWEARARVLRDQRVVLGASDAGAHLDMIDTFSYTTHLLEHAVRRHELISTEEAVHLMTQVPAGLYGLSGRGVLREGAWGDMVVFDEDTVGVGPLHTRADLPDGSARLFAASIGVMQVIVNGQPIVDPSGVTECRPGRVLRSGDDTTTPALTR